MKRIVQAVLAGIILASAVLSAQSLPGNPRGASPAAGSLIEAVFVPGGNFPREGSVVTISSFYIGKYEVTQTQYQALTGSDPSRFTGDANRPVEGVTWYDAVSFCNALSAKEGLQPVYVIDGTEVSADFTRNGWRLPTEAEWEYAARGGGAGKGHTYAGSDDIDAVAWYGGRSGAQTMPVGGKAPNELGLYDMSGNVFEWCHDWYGEYGKGPQADPRGPASGYLKVMRGGSWYRDAVACAVYFRVFNRPDYSRGGLGFRVARSGG